MTAAPVTNPTTGIKLTYGPLASGRTYKPWFSTNLMAANWTTLIGYLGPVVNAGNATNATLTDTNLALSVKFYRLSISYP
jgi:hypothetical protein